MIIRPAEARDAASIAGIVNPIIAETAITFTTAQKSPDSVAAEIVARDGAYFVAEAQTQIVGFATYFPFRGGPGYARTKEHSIVLAEGARGQGTGRALMSALLEHAAACDVHSIWAGVSAENPVGVRFHTALGFCEIARLPQVGYKFGRWMDLVLMQKIL